MAFPPRPSLCPSSPSPSGCVRHCVAQSKVVAVVVDVVVIAAMPLLATTAEGVGLPGVADIISLMLAVVDEMAEAMAVPVAVVAVVAAAPFAADVAAAGHGRVAERSLSAPSRCPSAADQQGSSSDFGSASAMCQSMSRSYGNANASHPSPSPAQTVLA